MVMGEAQEHAEVVVVGGGPGGYTAAFRAADLGKQVALVEMEKRLGGVCLLRGCIPSKALITAAELVQRIRNAEPMGIKTGAVEVNLPKLIAWKNGIIEELARGLDTLAKARKIIRYTGRATFRNAHELYIHTAEQPVLLRFEHAIIATGTSPIVPPPLERNELIITSDEALDLTELPRSLLVVGGGYIGIELGSCFAALGSQVTVVEMLDRLLPGTDPELVRVVRKHLEESGVRVHLQSKVTQARIVQGRVQVTIEHQNGQTSTGEFDRVLVAVGRRPNSDNLGLEKAGIHTDAKGYIPVNERCQTQVPHIFAIGDITGPPALAHRARRQGIVAAEVLAGLPAAFDNRTVPAVIFSDPEIAYCGLSEEEARAAGYRVKVGRFRLAASGRAKTLAQQDGLVIVIAEEGSEVVLGVRMVGPHVSELIAEATLAIEMGATLEDLISTIHPHPTLSETLQEAAEAARGQAIHAPPTRSSSTKSS
ncbi:MAG: dihydrolipoyl dehydrogenase [Gemmatales bacterium]|nr:dihydrolipoyl dehydrogenase [Gemmatales bacterium]MDW7994952.1 dihydrolipoyl dehydrogenase [Gemmatales bacterium]